MSEKKIKEWAKSVKVTVGCMILPSICHYGNYDEYDKLVDSEDVNQRIQIAKQGYGLDKLKDDADPRVRLVVAKKGYFIDQLIKDPSEEVRLTAKKYYL